jgi:hypothetical protein
MASNNDEICYINGEECIQRGTKFYKASTGEFVGDMVCEEPGCPLGYEESPESGIYTKIPKTKKTKKTKTTKK